MPKISTAIMSGLFALLLSACAGQQSKGDKMIAQSGRTQELGEQWNDGNDLKLQGEKLKKEGESLVRDGEAKINKGKALVSKGSSIVQEAEKAYAERFPSKTLE